MCHRAEFRVRWGYRRDNGSQHLLVHIVTTAFSLTLPPFLYYGFVLCIRSGRESRLGGGHGGPLPNLSLINKWQDTKFS